MKVLLGVTGGIAAYKACEVLREFQKKGHEVTVVMTSAAKEFVGPISFEALSGKKVYDDLFSGSDRGMAHIELARAHDFFLIAPASAGTISKMAQGQADNLLLTLYLAFQGRVCVAPAMNTLMWKHPATQRNLKQLEKDGVAVLETGFGELACGEVGEGKLLDPYEIVEKVLQHAQPAQKLENLKGKRILITAGPTREYLDPVRFLSSPSTGKMGIAIANAFAEQDAQVTLVHGPIHIEGVHPQVALLGVNSANEMFEAVEKNMAFDVFIGSAAVADYTPANKNDHKLKKAGEDLSVTFKRTPDILKYIGAQKKDHQIVIGFAAETQDVLSSAKAKLKDKKADLIVANEVYKEQKGFGLNRTSVTFVFEDEEVHLKNVSKKEVGEEICHWVNDLYQES